MLSGPYEPQAHDLAELLHQSKWVLVTMLWVSSGCMSVIGIRGMCLKGNFVLLLVIHAPQLCTQSASEIWAKRLIILSGQSHAQQLRNADQSWRRNQWPWLEWASVNTTGIHRLGRLIWWCFIFTEHPLSTVAQAWLCMMSFSFSSSFSIVSQQMGFHRLLQCFVLTEQALSN